MQRSVLLIIICDTHTNTHTHTHTESDILRSPRSIRFDKYWKDFLRGKSAKSCNHFSTLNMPLRLHRQRLFWFCNVKKALSNCSIIITLYLLSIARIFIFTEQKGEQNYLESTYACMHVTTGWTAFVFAVLLACEIQSSTYRSPKRFCEFCIKLYI